MKIILLVLLSVFNTLHAQTAFTDTNSIGIDGTSTASSSTEINFNPSGLGSSVTDIDVLVNFEKIGGTPANCKKAGGTGTVSGQPISNQIKVELITENPSNPTSPITVQLINNNYTTTTFANTISTWFSDSVTSTLSTTPISGIYKPATGQLSAFNGLDPNRNWKIKLTDASNGTLCYVSSTLVIRTNSTPLANTQISIGDGGTITETNSGNTNFNFSVTRTNSATPAFFQYKVLPGTGIKLSPDANKDVNIDEYPLFFTFNTGETSKNISIPIVGEETVEADETFSVQIISGSENVTFNDNTGVGTIINDDTAYLEIDDTSITEGTASDSLLQFTVSLDKKVDIDVKFNRFTENNTALTTDSDYTAIASSQLTIPAYSLSTADQAPYRVTVKKDNKVENNESLKLTLNGLTLANSRNVFLRKKNTTTTATSVSGLGTITNDDTATISLNVTSSSVNEGSAATAEIVLSNPVDSAVNVFIESVDGTAKSVDANNVDFPALAKTTKTFTANTTTLTQSVSITPVADTVVENSENFKFRLSYDNLPSSVTVVNGYTLAGKIVSDQEITIISSDVSTIRLDQTEPSAVEGNGTDTNSVPFKIILSKKIDRAVKVQFNVNDITATRSNNDYNYTDGLITIPAHTTNYTINVPITADNRVEQNETIEGKIITTAGIDNGGLPSNQVLFYTANATYPSPMDVNATITNDDIAIIKVTNHLVETNPISVNEGAVGATLIYRISISNPIDNTITFNAATVAETAAGTATVNSDYTAIASTPIQLGLVANNLVYSTDIAVPVLNDNITEENETVKLKLSSLNIGGAPAGTVKFESGATTQEANGIIDSDDSSEVVLSDVTFTEGSATTVSFNVSLTNPVDEPVTMKRRTLDGTAKVADGDYTALALAALSIPANSTAAVPVAVTITNDKVVEKSEDLFLELSDLLQNHDVSFPSSSSTLSKKATINDTDTANITVSDVTVAEGTSGSFVLNLGTGVSIDKDISFTVNTGNTVSSADVDAIPNTDYNPISNQVFTLSKGLSSLTIPVITINESVVEPAEAFQITFNIDTNDHGTNISFNGSQSKTNTGNITSTEDKSVLKFGTAPTVLEGGTLRYSVELTNPVQGIVTTQFSAVDANGGTAISTNTGVIGDTDYTPVTQAVTFNSGETSKFVDVETIQDNIVELNNTIKGKITSSTSTLTGVTLSGLTTLTGSLNLDGTITNDDISIVSVNDPITNEGNPLVYTISLSNPVDTSITVKAGTTTGGTATAGASADYTALSSATVHTFAAGTTSKNVSITTRIETPTNIVENAETVKFSANTLSVASRNVKFIGTPSPTSIITTGTIVDGSTSIVSISDITNNYTGANYETGTITFKVNLSSALGTTVSLKVSTVDGTATAGSDFVAKNLELVQFTAGQTSKTVTINKINDSTVEDSIEDFTIRLSDIVGNIEFIGGSSVTTYDSPAINIQDDDTSAVLFDTALMPTSIGEGTLVRSVIKLTNPVDVPVSVNLMAIPQTANLIENQDYTLPSLVANFPANSVTPITIDIPVLEDNIVEANEDFKLYLGDPTVGGLTRNITNSVPEISAITRTITSNDGSTLTVSATDTIEGNIVDFNIALSNPIDIPITVNYVTGYTTFTGNADAADFTPTSGSVTFDVGEQTKTVQVSTTLDDIVEVNERFKNTISLVTTGRNITVVPDGVVYIINDDQSIVTISNPSVSENVVNPKLQFQIDFSKEFDTNITLSKRTIDGTAVKNSDYTEVALSGLTLNAGDNSLLVEVPVLNDNLVEADETMQLELSNLSTIRSVKFNNNQPTILGTGTITSEDESILRITNVSDSNPNSESGTITYTLQLSNVVANTFTVNSRIINGTTSNADLVLNNSTITFNPNEQTKTITVTKTDDNIVEDLNETFELELYNLGAPVKFENNATTVRASSQIIKDNDKAIVSISSASVTEGSTLSFNISLGSKVVDQPITLRYSTSDGTANISDSDYTASNFELLTIPAQSNSVVISIPTTNDTKVEDNENINLVLSDLSDSTRDVDFGATSAIGTITNNDSAVISISNPFISEGDTLNYVVSINNTVDIPFSILANTSNGTATTDDYSQVINQAIVFNGSNNSQIISVPTNNDSIVEQNETVNLILSGITINRNVVFSNNLSTLAGIGTIIEGGIQPTVSVAISNSEIQENGNAVNVTATLSNITGSTVLVNLTPLGQAVNGVDYNLPTQISILPGSLTGTVNLTPINDSIFENKENLTITVLSVNNATITGNAIFANIIDDEALLDSDNDGLTNGFECTEISACTNSDKDAVPNYLDQDSDNDGIYDIDEKGFNGTTLLDTDLDRIPNIHDLDSDNDGIVDLLEAQTSTGVRIPSKVDSNNNGLDDEFDIALGKTKFSLMDNDFDGKPDYIDTDSDDDGISDLVENFDLNSDGNTDIGLSGLDSDSDGIDNNFDQYNNNIADWKLNISLYNAFRDSDKDSLPDTRDRDYTRSCTQFSVESTRAKLADLRTTIYKNALSANTLNLKNKSCKKIASKTRNKLLLSMKSSNNIISTLITNLPGSYYTCNNIESSCSFYDIFNFKNQINVNTNKLLKDSTSLLGNCSKKTVGKLILNKIKSNITSNKAALTELPDSYQVCR